MYVSTRDAVSRVASLVFAKTPPRAPKLWYLEPEAGDRPRGLIPGEGLEEAVDRLDRSLRARNVGSRVH